MCLGNGTATGYGLNGPGIESRGGEIFRTCPDRPWGPPSLLYNGYRVFPGVKSGRSVTLTPHPLLVPLVMKEWSYTSTPPMGRTACTEPQCPYKGALYLLLRERFVQEEHPERRHTGCPRRKGQNFGRVFLMLKYTDITQNTYIQC